MTFFDHKQVFEFLHSQPLATVSTISSKENKPESALVAFTETSELEIIFETFVDSRKYSNLCQNPNVSLVIGWDEKNYITLQYEGVAQEVEPHEIEIYRNLFLAKKTPCSEEFLFHEKVKFFKVRPTWIRFSNYRIQPPQIIEKNFQLQTA